MAPATQGERLVCRLSNFHHPKCSVTNLVHSHPFVHQIQVLLPCELNADAHAAVSAALTATLRDLGEFWIMRSQAVHELIEKATSCGLLGAADMPWSLQLAAPSGSGGAVGGLAVAASTGLLLWRVEAETYQELGLPGAKSSALQGNPSISSYWFLAI